jgi:hypothetical protein
MVHAAGERLLHVRLRLRDVRRLIRWRSRVRGLLAIRVRSILLRGLLPIPCLRVRRLLRWLLLLLLLLRGLRLLVVGRCVGRRARG